VFLDGEIFQLSSNAGDGCVSLGRLKSNGGWIYQEFYMPGCGDTLALGNVYDYKECVVEDP
jgi:hypothetical protein